MPESDPSFASALSSEIGALWRYGGAPLLASSSAAGDARGIANTKSVMICEPAMFVPHEVIRLNRISLSSITFSAMTDVLPPPWGLWVIRVGGRLPNGSKNCGPRQESILSAERRAAFRNRTKRRAAVIELCTRVDSASVAARRAPVSKPLLYKWKNQLLGREVPASRRRHKKTAPTLERAELEERVESL